MKELTDTGIEVDDIITTIAARGEKVSRETRVEMRERIWGLLDTVNCPSCIEARDTGQHCVIHESMPVSTDATPDNKETKNG